ncbi:hypothetical protein A2W24_00025 [Microgenomates group bacterium RBG_16_45_19]|nr:MAG: hypothetical protein A2W24_00025 [Microgenomates group bacterium RBG_16_45_19]
MHEQGLPGSEKHVGVRHEARILQPEIALSMITRGAKFVEIDSFEHLDAETVRTLAQYHREDRPLLVNVLSGEVNLEGGISRSLIDAFVSHLEGVDGVIASPMAGPDYTIRGTEAHLLSNVHCLGTSLCTTSHERLARTSSPHRDRAIEAEVIHSKYTVIEDLPSLVKQYQNLGKKVVVVSGVFDILHPGHLALFTEAKEQGEVLVVLTNSDYSVGLQDKNANGERPIHPLGDRVGVLGAMDLIDHLSAFDEKSIYQILEQLPGIIYVKTEKDIGREMIQQEMDLVRNLGGEVRVVATVRSASTAESLSSTGIISAIRTQLLDQKLWDCEMAEYPDEVRGLLYGMILKMAKYDEQTGKLTQIRDALVQTKRMKPELSLAIEVAQIRALGEVAEEMTTKGLVGEKPYHAYMVPYLLGRVLDLDTFILPMQIRQSEGYPYVMVGGFKLRNGQWVVYNSQDRSFSDPFIFENKFWKPLPNQLNYITKDKDFRAKRIFVHPPETQRQAVALLMIKDELNKAEAGQQSEWITLFKKTASSCFDDFIDSEQIPKMVSQTKLMSERTYRHECPKIVAHGGVAILNAETQFPENSREGIGAALESGVDVVEIDIVPTGDNQWIVSHDIDLGIATKGTGLTTEKTLAELTQTELQAKSGDRPTTLMSLDEVLAIVALYRPGDLELKVKIDVKFMTPEAVAGLVNSINKSNLSPSQILVTCGPAEYMWSIRAIDDTIGFEFNTVEPVNFMLSHGLYSREMIEAFLAYIVRWAPYMNAKQVSLMQVAMNYWGREVFQNLVKFLHDQGMGVQIWTASTMAEYDYDRQVGVDYVLMHDPSLISEVTQNKDKS